MHEITLYLVHNAVTYILKRVLPVLGITLFQEMFMNIEKIPREKVYEYKNFSLEIISSHCVDANSDPIVKIIS